LIVRQITATEAARRFSEVLDAVEHAGETFVITRGGRAVASIVPAPAGNGGALREVLRRHRPDPGWAEEIREMRRLLTDRDLPWPD
jgi:prevent-host-death family protein